MIGRGHDGLLFYSLVDGRLLGTVSYVGCEELTDHFAISAADESIYALVRTPPDDPRRQILPLRGAVGVASCSARAFSDSRGSLNKSRLLHGIDHRFVRGLVVMPPARGKAVSHLIVHVCRGDGPALLVYALPGVESCVHEQQFPRDRSISALAADPYGTCLAVADSGEDAVDVLPWPFTGMAPLR
jgi:hypothetical protein